MADVVSIGLVDSDEEFTTEQTNALVTNETETPSPNTIRLQTCHERQDSYHSALLFMVFLATIGMALVWAPVLLC